MTTRHRTVHVRVHEGVLWVEGEAYPLRNIAHVGQRILEIDKGAAWKRFILRSIGCLVIGAIFMSMGSAGTLVWLAMQALLVWQLVRTISKPTLYGLVLNTAGTQHDAVWSTDSQEIMYLVGEITKAIGHPDIAQVTYNLSHAVQGDVVNNYGSGIGKAEHGGSGSIRTS